MTENKKIIDWTKVLIGCGVLLCSIALFLIATSLRPIAKWADYQSTCVEQEIEKAPISWAVRKCNGRSKVYQIKEPTKN